MRRTYKRKLLKLRFLIKPTLIVGVFFLVLFIFIRLCIPVYKFSSQNEISLQFISSLIFDKEVSLKNYQGRINIILLGMAGTDHDGSDLTDTVIFLSFNFEKEDILMLSIPRDLWLSSLRAKINSAYHYGEQKKKEGGLIMAKASIEEVVGQPVHYGLTLDFSGFKRLIDLMGGIDIFIEKGFTDDKYPIKGKEDDFCGGDPTFACRYETIHFEKGLQHMDGERALKYVRSRQSEGDEGTGFARDKRQQQVLVALKNKIIDYPFWSQPNKLKEMLNKINEMIQTDMNWSEKVLLIKSLWNLRHRNIRRINLDSGNKEKEIKGFLKNPSIWEYDGVWVLIPRTGDFEEIHEYISCQLEDPDCSIRP